MTESQESDGDSSWPGRAPPPSPTNLEVKVGAALARALKFRGPVIVSFPDGEHVLDLEDCGIFVTITSMTDEARRHHLAVMYDFDPTEESDPEVLVREGPPKGPPPPVPVHGSTGTDGASMNDSRNTTGDAAESSSSVSLGESSGTTRRKVRRIMGNAAEDSSSSSSESESSDHDHEPASGSTRNKIRETRTE